MTIYLGSDSYLRIQKETSWGSAITSAMTLLPIVDGTTVNTIIEHLPDNSMRGNRLRGVPTAGITAVTGTIQIEAYPTLIGHVLLNLLGTSANATVDTGVYMHTWLCPVTGDRAGTSWTIQVARGGDLAEQITGAKITKVSIESAPKDKVKLSLDFIGKTYTADVARITTFTWPAVAPFIGGHLVTKTMNPGGAGDIAATVRSWKLEIDLGYGSADDHHAYGATTITEPIFMGIPSVTATVGIDALPAAVDAARAITSWALAFSFQGATISGANKYKLEFDIPAATLSQDTIIAIQAGKLGMDLIFDCMHGGTTTGSGAVAVPFEARVQDATATWAV